MVGITVFHPLSQWRQRLETRNPEIRLPSSVDVIETSCRREREIRHRLQAAAAEPLKPNVAGGEEPPAIGRLPSTPLLLDGGPVVDSAAAAPPQGEAVGRGGDRRRPQRARRRRLPRPRRPLRRRARAPWRPRRRRRLRVRPRPGLPLLPLQLPPQPPPPRPDPGAGAGEAWAEALAAEPVVIHAMPRRQVPPSRPGRRAEPLGDQQVLRE